MKQRQGDLRLIGYASISSLLLFGPLGPATAPTPIFAGEAERTREGKPADFVLVVKDNNLISLKAKDASLKKVLEEIGRRMNIEMFALLPEQEKITTEFETLPLEEAIERLIRNYPHLIVSQDGDRRITRIVALQKSIDTGPSKPVIEDTKKQDAPVKLETRVKEQPIRKESPPPEPFKFQFDPSQYGEKRR